MKQTTRVLLCLLCMMTGIIFPAAAQWQDEQNLTVDYSPRPTFDRVNRLYAVPVTLTNVGNETLGGPMRVMIDSSSHPVLNSDGEVDEIPYLMMDIEELAAGASHSFILQIAAVRAPLSLQMRMQIDTQTSNTILALDNDQIAIFYNREDDNYTGWGLHLWNGQACGNYAAPTTESVHFSNWPNPYPADGIHPDYGAYFILTVEPGATCYNFIIHKGDEKALGPNDSAFNPELGQEGFTFHGSPEIWYQPFTAPPVFLDGARAHWMNTNTLLWQIDTGSAAAFRLYGSENAEVDQFGQETLASTPYVSLTPQGADQAMYDQNPHLSSFSGFTLDMTDEEAANWARYQLVAVAVDEQGEPLAMTSVQTPRLLDYLYTRGEADADEATLGAVYANGSVQVSVWAPTARGMTLQIFNADKSPFAEYAMTYDGTTGIWHYSAPRAELDRKFYRYSFEAYHPLTRQVEALSSTDPYSVGLSTNGRYTQFVDLSDEDLKPAGWDGHAVPTVDDPEDAVIYEGHIRDFSIDDESTSEANRGKYLAFTEANSVPVQHLKALQQAGLTHFHMLPANDIATINEDAAQRVELTDTVADLCAINSDSPVCGVENPSATLQSVLQSYDPASTDAQALVESMRGLDGFNWGYDPHHFAAPEGSYSSNPDGIARIVEMRAMNQALHEMGLRVVLDVVYNHTASSGLFDNSVLDKVVPGYYHRLSETTGDIERSTCCENTATEHVMMDKLMSDSLVSFAEHFGFDSFRFDLMGHIPRQAILDAREAVEAVDPDTYFYGEGWNFGEVVNNRRFEQAAQLNMAGTEVGTFSDRQREAVRSGNFASVCCSLHDMDTIRVGLVGNVGSYEFVTGGDTFVSTYDYQWGGQPAGYSSDPADTVNYVSKHDNETLWDQLQYANGSAMSAADRVRIHMMGLSFPLLSQGIPFMHMGSELIRSKSMDRNTYDAGDWYNKVDFTQTDNNWNVGLPLAQDNQGRWGEISPISANPNTVVSSEQIQLSSAVFNEFLAVRASSKLFRLATAQQIRNRIKFHNTGSEQQPQLIVMSLDDGAGLPDLDPEHDAIVVIFNGNATAQSFFIADTSNFELHNAQFSGADAVVQSASFSNGEFTVPAYSTAVFVKPQAGEQGSGINARPPFGDTDIYLRGSMNDWAADTAFSYQGNDSYEVTVDLLEGEHQFKIASEDWIAANIGNPDNTPLPLGTPVTIGGDSNLVFFAASDASYTFKLDATNTATPELLISSSDPDAVAPPYGNATIYVRGSMNEWSTNDAMAYEGEGIYRATLEMAVGDYAFKVASEDWSTANLGNAANMTPGDTIDLFPGGDNIGLSVEAPQTLEFVLDASDVLAPVLTVRPLVPYGDTVMYLRGNMNDWGTGNPMTYDGSVNYAVEMQLDAGTHVFKVADESFGLAFGSDSPFALSTAAQLSRTGADIVLTLSDAETVLFNLNADQSGRPVLTAEPVLP